MSAESVATILVACKQTRFHIGNPNYRELDVDGLSITVTWSGPDKPARGKGKTRTINKPSLEILSSATLRLKAGRRYALVGANGSGKSTLLRAIAERLIPGIPDETRITILQQTTTSDPPTLNTVLDEVIDKATSNHVLHHEIALLAAAVNSADDIQIVRSWRQVRHDRMQKRLFVLDKMARLRSGARGSQARKELIAFEKELAEFQVLCEQTDDEMSSSALEAEIQEASDMLAQLQLGLAPSRITDMESRAKKILAGLGFSEAYMAKPVSELSGGWKMRTALAAALLQDTDVLILDEPTNFLDLLGILWLQRHLEALGDHPDAPTLVFVSHDRDFSSLCTDLLIVKDKDLVSFSGNLETYESSMSDKRQYLTKMKEAKDKQKAHIQSTIQRSMAEGKKKNDDNRVRQAKQRQKKLDDRWGLEVSAKGGRFKLNRDLVGYHLTSRAQVEIPPEDLPPVIELPKPPDLRFPGPLLSMEGVSFSYAASNKNEGAKKPALDPVPPAFVGLTGANSPNPHSSSAVLQDATLSINVGDRVGIMGLNGAGKSTLIKLLVGELQPTSGTLATHPRLKLGYYGQDTVEALQAQGRAEPELTSLALLARDVGGELDEGQLRGLLGELGLHGRLAADVPVRKLSGGQLVRCALARILWRCPHCLVLDEVTTHLDYETTTALREALRDWGGAVVLVSHDRWFMRGAVEGRVQDENEEEEEEEEEEEDGVVSSRRRVVYRIKQGVLTNLDNGVQRFEDLVERRVKNMMSC